MTSEERREARYQRRKEKRQQNRQARSDALGPCVHFTLRERGKIRQIDAPHITDRQIHKVLTTRVLSPLYGPCMIYDNGASQKDKGLHFHYERLKVRLRKHYRKYGTGGVIDLADYHGFFQNADREIILERHRRLILNPDLRAIADAVVINAPGIIGMPLGVEPSQQEMVSMPSAVDTFMACQIGAEATGHYMDDYHFMAATREDGEAILAAFIARSTENHIEVNPAKCKIVAAGEAFRFCKAKFQLLPSGRIITHGSRDGIKRARRKMRHFKQEVDAGRMTTKQVAEWMKSQTAYYENYNDHGRVLRLNRLFYAMFVRSESHVQDH